MKNRQLVVLVYLGWELESAIQHHPIANLLMGLAVLVGLVYDMYKEQQEKEVHNG